MAPRPREVTTAPENEQNKLKRAADLVNGTIWTLNTNLNDAVGLRMHPREMLNKWKGQIPYTEQETNEIDAAVTADMTRYKTLTPHETFTPEATITVLRTIEARLRSQGEVG